LLSGGGPSPAKEILALVREGEKSIRRDLLGEPEAAEGENDRLPDRPLAGEREQDLPPGNRRIFSKRKVAGCARCGGAKGKGN